jgi:translation initiation factor 1A
MTKGNTTGGKNYKKSKHGGVGKPPYPEREKDQLWARVIKNLGNRNLQCYCNDGKARICHIRGAMRNRIWINTGDLVLISLRDFDTGEIADRGDIIAKFDMDHLHRLKTEPGINGNLFLAIETGDSKVAAIGSEEGFEFDAPASKEGEEDEEEELDIDDI